MKNKKKLLFLCQNYYPEMVSTGLHMTELTENLIQEGFEIDVFCSYPSDRLAFDKKAISYRDTYKGVKVYRSFNFGEHNRGLLSRAFYGLGYFFQAFFFCIWNTRRYGLMVITTNPPYLGVLSYLMKKILNNDYAIIVHDIYPEILHKLEMVSDKSITFKFWHYLNKKIFNAASKIIVLGRDAESIVSKRLKEKNLDKTIVITSWSDSKKVFPVPREENTFIKEHNLEGKFIVLYAGNMGRTHNIEPILEASDEITDDNVVFLFVGDGKKSELVREKIERETNKNIKLLPLQPAERLSEMLSSADISVVCLEESFTGYSVPSKTYGVLASGKPVLGLLSEKSEISQMLIEKNCGVVLTNATKDQVVDAIKDAIVNPQKWQEMGKRGREAFFESYTLQSISKRYSSLFKSLLNA